VRGGDGVDYRAGEGEVLSPGGGHGNILADAAVVAREEVEGGPAGDDARALVVQQGQGLRSRMVVVWPRDLSAMPVARPPREPPT